MSDTPLLDALKPAPKEIRFFIPGEVRGWGRAGARIIKYKDKVSGADKQFISHYTDSKTRNYEAKIATLAMTEKGRVGWNITEAAVRLHVIAHFEMPASWSNKKKAALLNKPATAKPDADNIIKGVADALNKVLYVDDKQVAITICEKLYVSAEQGEGLWVKVSECG